MVIRPQRMKSYSSYNLLQPTVAGDPSLFSTVCCLMLYTAVACCCLQILQNTYRRGVERLIFSVTSFVDDPQYIFSKGVVVLLFDHEYKWSLCVITIIILCCFILKGFKYNVNTWNVQKLQSLVPFVKIFAPNEPSV